MNFIVQCVAASPRYQHVQVYITPSQKLVRVAGVSAAGKGRAQTHSARGHYFSLSILKVIDWQMYPIGPDSQQVS